MNSREKGKSYERELSHKLNAYGYETRRGAQYNGSDGSADVVGLYGVHIEAKHCEQFRIYDWMEQAVRDTNAEMDKEKHYIIPTVFYRKNYKEDLVTVRLDDWQMMYDAWYEKRTGKKGVSR